MKKIKFNEEKTEDQKLFTIIEKDDKTYHAVDLLFVTNHGAVPIKLNAFFEEDEHGYLKGHISYTIKGRIEQVEDFVKDLNAEIAKSIDATIIRKPYVVFKAEQEYRRNRQKINKKDSKENSETKNKVDSAVDAV